MITKELKVINELGIHARPSSLIVKTALKFKSKIDFVKEDTRANAKSIMEVMMLAAVYGTQIKLIVEGEDEIEAALEIENIFINGFFESYK